MTMKIEPWRCLERKSVLRFPPWLEVESHTLRLPDGREIENWPWIISPDFINVVAVTEAGEFLCFRQQKYAAEGVTLAVPGGYLEPGEDPETCARRELREETGMVSDQWRALGSYAVDGNRGCGRGHFFLAENCRHAGGEKQEDLEDQELLRLGREEVLQALAEERFGVMPWVTALALALLGMERRADSESF